MYHIFKTQVEFLASLNLRHIYRVHIGSDHDGGCFICIFSSDSTYQLNTIPCPATFIPSSSSHTSSHLPHCSPPVNPSASPCLALPHSPDSTNYWSLSTRSGHSREAMLTESKTLLLSSFLATHADMKLRGCGTLVGCHASSFALLQPPWHRLNPISRFMVSLSFVFVYVCKCLCMCHSLSHTGM